MFTLQQIDHVALTVTDLERSTRWYVETLGFEHLHPGMWNGVPVFVGKPGMALALFPLRDSSPTKAKGLRILHIAFRASAAEFQNAERSLAARGIPLQAQDHGISHSIYFHDPDGHEIEITTYERDEPAHGA